MYPSAEKIPNLAQEAIKLLVWMQEVVLCYVNEARNDVGDGKAPYPFPGKWSDDLWPKALVMTTSAHVFTFIISTVISKTAKHCAMLGSIYSLG